MFSKESLYISAVKLATSLKLDFKKLEDGNIIEASQSTFLTDDEIISRDAVHKINPLQENTPKTYLSTLLIKDDIKLVRKNDSKKLKDYASASLNNDYDLVILKNKLFETKHYFEATGIDYVFSAFHILNLYIEKNAQANSLICLTFNNKAYIAILNANTQIVFSVVKPLTAFKNIKGSKFYDNDVLGQKLYDEIHYLELGDIIHDVTSEFYQNTNDLFIEDVVLLYSVKQLSNDQVKLLNEELMLNITYHPINIEEALFELVKDNQKNKSFILPRKKVDKKTSKIYWILTILLILSALIYQFVPIKQIIQDYKNPPKKIEKKVKKEFNLPNHIQKNREVEKRVLGLFDTIPFDVLVKEIEISKSSSKIIADFLSDDIFIKTMQPKLLRLYKKSTIEFKQDKNIVYEGVITNENAKPSKVVGNKLYNDTYITDEFIPIIRVTEQLKTLFPKNTLISFKSNFKSDVVTFNYLVNMVVKTPMEFFNAVEMLNNELYSIHVTYPILFVKTEAGLEVEFILQFHQPK